MSSSDLPIPRDAYKGVIIVFCILAIVGAVARTIICFRNRQLRVLDDALLLSACVCLTAATVLLVNGASSLYLITAFQTNPQATTITSLQQFCVFAVKFCYLFFFRQLIDRLTRITIYWRITLAFTFIACIFNACGSFIACPEFGDNNLRCMNPYYIRRTTAVEATTIVFDIVSDLMILTIPPYLIWKVRISRRQKLGIAFFLCLSTSMVIIAIIRISQVHSPIYNIWATFWQQLEGCVAILMVSLTAFRTLFVTSPTNSQVKAAKKHSDGYRKRLWYKYKASSGDRDGGSGKVERVNIVPVDVTVPNAILRVMRTYIRGSPRLSEFGSPEWKGGRDPSCNTTHVTHDMEWHTDSVRSLYTGTYEIGISGSVLGGQPCMIYPGIRSFCSDSRFSVQSRSIKLSAGLCLFSLLLALLSLEVSEIRLCSKSTVTGSRINMGPNLFEHVTPSSVENLCDNFGAFIVIPRPEDRRSGPTFLKHHI
ncbi:MAG: hypothetical protein Q9199_002500 [Rusavskia elegans]